MGVVPPGCKLSVDKRRNLLFKTVVHSVLFGISRYRPDFVSVLHADTPAVRNPCTYHAILFQKENRPLEALVTMEKDIGFSLSLASSVSPISGLTTTGFHVSRANVSPTTVEKTSRKMIFRCLVFMVSVPGKSRPDSQPYPPTRGHLSQNCQSFVRASRKWVVETLPG